MREGLASVRGECPHDWSRSFRFHLVGHTVRGQCLGSTGLREQVFTGGEHLQHSSRFDTKYCNLMQAKAACLVASEAWLALPEALGQEVKPLCVVHNTQQVNKKTCKHDTVHQRGQCGAEPKRMSGSTSEPA